MNKTLTTMIALLTLASACRYDQSEARDGVVMDTLALTAQDTLHGQRPLIDVGQPVRWIIDGTTAPIDLGLIDVGTEDESMSLEDVLLSGGLTSDEVTTLGHEVFEMAPTVRGVPSTAVGGVMGEQSTTPSRTANARLPCLIVPIQVIGDMWVSVEFCM